MQSIAAAALRMSGEMVGQGITNILWALSKLKFSDQPFLTAIASAARATICESTAPNLSGLAWAYASLE